MRAKARIPSESRVIFLVIGIRSDGRAASAAFAPALLCVRATDAGLAALLSTDKIPYDSRYDGKYDQNNDNVRHNYILTDTWSFEPLSAYSAFSFLLVFITRPTTIPIIARTAIAPPIAPPICSAEASTISVPIVFTR